MKVMKKVIVTALFTILSLSMFAQAKTDKLPETARNFLNEHFSSISITEVKENSNWEIWEDEKFEVKLSNGIEIDFDEKGNAIEIDTNADKTIPLQALPFKIVDYLKENYPDAGVTAWEKDSKEQEIELGNGTELEFDADGNFRKID